MTSSYTVAKDDAGMDDGHVVEAEVSSGENFYLSFIYGFIYHLSFISLSSTLSTHLSSLIVRSMRST